MLNKRTLSWVGLVLLALGFIIVFLRVLEMRIESGDAYAHYSTLRNDPLGCSALSDSLASIEGITVEQNLTSLTAIKSLDADSVLLILGLPWDGFRDLRAKDDSPVLRAVEDKGARLVITLNPQMVPMEFRKKETEEEEDWFDRRRKAQEKRRLARKGKDNKKTEEEKLSEEEELEKEADKMFGLKLGEIIDVEIPDLKDYKRPENGWKMKPGKNAGKGAPSALPKWFSQYRLKPKNKDWKQMGLIGKDPVLMERKWGKGTIVLATDTYFASNESLHRGAEPDFLRWLTGGKKHIIFDETIHGSINSGGTMKLIRSYRLHGFFFGIFIFIGLWAWRSATSLTPGDESIERGLIGGATVSGEQTNSGFINLLRRSISGKDLISQCFDIWSKSQISRMNPDQEKKVSAIIASHKANPRKYSVTYTYQAISRALKKH